MRPEFCKAIIIRRRDRNIFSASILTNQERLGPPYQDAINLCENSQQHARPASPYTVYDFVVLYACPNPSLKYTTNTTNLHLSNSEILSQFLGSCFYWLMSWMVPHLSITPNHTAPAAHSLVRQRDFVMVLRNCKGEREHAQLEIKLSHGLYAAPQLTCQTERSCRSPWGLRT